MTVERNRVVASGHPLDATEEAVYNSLLKAPDSAGSSQTVRALPVDRLKELFAKYSR